MKPQEKEKAEELLALMTQKENAFDKQQQKICALIAVKFARENPLNTEGYNKYLDKVKKEIEKL